MASSLFRSAIRPIPIPFRRFCGFPPIFRPSLSFTVFTQTPQSSSIGVVSSVESKDSAKVLIDSAKKSVHCRISKMATDSIVMLKRELERITPGDRVRVTGINWTEGKGVLEEVFPTESFVHHPPAANVDRILMIFTPEVSEKTIVRFVLEAHSNGLPYTLALNKAEPDCEAFILWQSRMKDLGWDPISMTEITSAASDFLKEKTTMLVGPSGVGKTSIINKLIGSNLKVGKISKNKQGVFTTTKTVLLPYPEGGYLIDTPGYNKPVLKNVTMRTLGDCIPEKGKLKKKDYDELVTEIQKLERKPPHKR